MDGPEGTGNHLEAKLARALRVRIPLANLAGAALAVVSCALTAAGIHGQSGIGPTDFIALGVFVAIVFPLGFWYGERTCGKAVAWMVDERPATREEQRRVLSYPWQTARFGLSAWSVAAVGWTTLALGGGHSW